MYANLSKLQRQPIFEGKETDSIHSLEDLYCHIARTWMKGGEEFVFIYTHYLVILWCFLIDQIFLN